MDLLSKFYFKGTTVTTGKDLLLYTPESVKTLSDHFQLPASLDFLKSRLIRIGFPHFYK